MGRFALVLGAVAVGIMYFNPDLVDVDVLKEKFLLVALLPAVYMLGLGLLKD